MPNRKQKLFTGVAVLAGLLLCAAGVEAHDPEVYGPTVVVDTEGNPTYSNDSSQVNSAFQAAVSAFDATVITFAETSTGGDPLAGSTDDEEDIDGTSFDTGVVFQSPDNTGDPQLVSVTGNNPLWNDPEIDDYVIGPLPDYSGPLEITFEGLGLVGAVSAVGIGAVGLLEGESISLYDSQDTLLLEYTLPAPGNSTFFVGFVPVEPSEAIGRVVIDGSLYTIQDLEYYVPEPTAALLQLATLASLAGLAAGRRRPAQSPR